jgi:hypothetical protein
MKTTIKLNTDNIHKISNFIIYSGLGLRDCSYDISVKKEVSYITFDEKDIYDFWKARHL